MPASVIVGGQFGSEGKGKVALEWVRRDPTISIAIRPGGTNSGHTGYTKDGRALTLRQLPAAAIDGNVKVVLPAGSYIDVELLEAEIKRVGLGKNDLHIDPRAHVIRNEHIQWEQTSQLVDSIGSTGSGTGAAVLSRLARYAPSFPSGTPASETPDLEKYLVDTSALIAHALQKEERVLIEGTQGFGLSPIHGDAWPKCTSRDTTAASFLSEAGISPLDVDQVVLVVRCHPIRVAGRSGPLIGETTWDQIAAQAGTFTDLREYTSVTKKVRRVGFFDPELVQRAIRVNAPTAIVLNHLDYIDAEMYGQGTLTSKAKEFIHHVEQSIGHSVSFFGTDERTIHAWSEAFA